MSEPKTNYQSWAIGILIFIVVFMGFSINSIDEEKNSVQAENDGLSSQVDNLRSKLDEANANIDEANTTIDYAKGQAWDDYETMGYALEAMDTVSTVSY